MGHAVPAMLLALLLFNVCRYLAEAAILCCFLLNVSNQSCVFSFRVDMRLFFSFSIERFPSDNKNTFLRVA